MMQIQANPEIQAYTIRPMNFGELMLIRRVIAMLNPGDKIEYLGRHGDYEDEDFHLTFGVGGQIQRKTRLKMGMRMTGPVYVGGLKFRLRGTDLTSHNTVGEIRDMCFYGSGGLTFIKAADTDVEGVPSLVCYGMPCKICGGQMIGMNCEWKVCPACAEKCDHTYVRGAVHGGGTKLGMGEFCDKCGRGKPKQEGDREKTEIEHHLAVKRELGVLVFYDEGPVRTPEQLVQLKRLVRRHERAKARQAQAAIVSG